jgi:hypothetical protein
MILKKTVFYWYPCRALSAMCLAGAGLPWTAGVCASSNRRVTQHPRDIVQQIGGSDVTVTSLMVPTPTLIAFEPKPDEARVLSQARDLIVNGWGSRAGFSELVSSHVWSYKHSAR